MSRAAQRILIAALSALIPVPAASAEAVLLQQVRIAPAVAGFGGISAVEMLDGGAAALVLSDRGRIFELALIRGPGGIAAASVQADATITREGGAQLPRGERDSEGLAMLPDGSLAISFEGGLHGRVAYHGRDGVQRAGAPRIPGAQDLPVNGGLEGLAIDARGRLHTLPEDMPGQGPIPLLRLDGGQWHVFAELPRAHGWSPVALDFDTEGRLYLLQRRTVLPLGFSARLTRFVFGPGDVVTPERLFQTVLGQHGNLEGLSVWRDGAGRLVATLVSDDDLMPFRATTLVEYLLPD